MSIMDMNLGNFNADEARYNRANRTNKPDYNPGMEPEMDLFNNTSQGGAMPVNNGAVGDIFSSSPQPIQGGFGQPMQGDFGQPMQGNINNGGSLDIFNSQPMGMTPSPNGMMQPQQPQLSQEEQFFQTMAKGGKKGLDFFSDLIQSFGQVTPKYWMDYGKYTMFIGLGVSASSLLLMLLGWKSGVNLLLAGLSSSVIGVLALFLNIDTVKSNNINSCYKDESPQAQPQQQFNQQPMDINPPQNNDFFNTTQDSSDGWDDLGSSDEDWDDDGIEDDDDFDDFSDIEDTMISQPVAEMSTEDALNSLQDVPQGMFTRQYLYDAFMKVLQSKSPDFSTFKEIDPDDDVFLYWDDKLQEVASVCGLKEDALDELELVRLRENLFTVELTTTRPAGFKSDIIATELANVYAYNDGNKIDGVFAKSFNVGSQSIITVFTGSNPMITVKDMINKERDWFLRSDVLMPVVWGVDQEGKVVKTDLKKLESLLITGMPRSGKSWLTTAVLTQMCAFMSPDDLNFYICDPKDGISDYTDFCLPHVKKFVSGDDNIVATVRDVVNVEASRRKKLLGDAGFKNIWDYKDRFPDVKLPVIYVVIDEVVTLAERMEKDTKAEFQGYLTQLITQLPALGIRAIFIPHVIKDQVIKKTTTDTILCRISVRGDAQHVETVTGAKPKDFPYKLANQGDMAVRIPDVSDKVMFVKAAVLSDSNLKNKELFDYMRRLWIKLVPDCASTSVVQNINTDKQNQEVLDNLNMNDFNLDDESLDFGDLFSN